MTSNPQPKWQGWSMALTTTLLFSAIPPMTKVLLQDGLETNTFLVIRYVCSSLLLLSTLAIINPQNLRVDSRGLAFCVLCGFLYASTAWTFTQALTYLSSSIASMIMAVAPLVTFLLLLLRGEKPTLRMLVRFILSFIGVYLILGPGGQVSLFGVMLVFISCLFYALYMVCLQWFLKAYLAQTSVLYIILSLTFFVTLNWLIQGPSLQPMSLKAWGFMLFIIIGGTFLAQLFLFRAVQVLGSSQMVLLGSVEIMLTLIWSALFLSDRLSLLQWLGSGLILLGMVLAIGKAGGRRKEIGGRRQEVEG
jgi:drug/metabolite transporter (DMT)-like permease